MRGAVATSGSDAAAGTAASWGAAPPARPDPDGQVLDGAPVEDLESEVYAARDLHGEEREEIRRALVQARSQMSDATYRRALGLARDSVLLSIDECLNGAVAMEWEPVRRPEFSLQTIEAAVAEQERNGHPDGQVEDQPEGRAGSGR
jgi:hypothetical protein